MATPLPASTPTVANPKSTDPNYIGSTNFANLQKQYTPYQIEQATERRGTDIYWKQGVNIADLPQAAPSPQNVQAPTTPVSAATMGTPTPNLVDPNVSLRTQEFEARNNAAQQSMTGLQAQIDNIRKLQEERATAEKEAKQKEVDTLKTRLDAFSNSTAAQDSLKADREKFQVENSIRLLGDIQTKMAQAQDALNQGLIYETGRPTRLELMSGRKAELQKQGLAQIQALQASAQIVNGNIELARAYANDSIDAIKKDNEQRIGVLGTLLKLAQDDLVSLTTEESETIKARMNALNEQSKLAEKNKDQIFDYAEKYPSAFTKGAVTFNDTPEAAYKKMLPYLTEYETRALEKTRLENQLLQSQINENNASAAKSRAAGSGTGTGIEGVSAAAVSESVTNLRNAGYSQNEIREGLYAYYGDAARKSTQFNALVDNLLQGGKYGADLKKEEIELEELQAKQDERNRGLITASGAKSSNADIIQKAVNNGLVVYDENSKTYKTTDKVLNYSEGHGIKPQNIQSLVEPSWLKNDDSKWTIKG